MKTLSLQAVLFLVIGNLAFSSDTLEQGKEEAVPVYLTRLQKAGESGNAEAFFLLGKVYDDGKLVAKDPVVAFHWYQKSADGDFKKGLFAVAYAYQTGYGAPQNYQLSRPLYLRAAEKGSASAAYTLGLIYDDGLGVEKNEAESNKWFEKSYEFSDLDGKVSVGEYYLLFRKDTPYEARGFKILEDAATNHDHTEAQASLATIYYILDRTYNAERAFYWLQKAAAKGHTEAEFYLGKMYMRGDNPPAVDEKKGIALWEKAAAKDYPQALFGLGMHYLLGKGGLPQNTDKGIAYLQKASNLGDCDAQGVLGALYVGSDYVDTDTAKGAALLEKAAAQGDLSSQVRLAQLYIQGKAVPQDVGRMIKLLKISADRGNAQAQGLVAALTELGAARKALGPDPVKTLKEGAAQEAAASAVVPASSATAPAPAQAPAAP